jgi:hypothetical protein
MGYKCLSYGSINESANFDDFQGSNPQIWRLFNSSSPRGRWSYISLSGIGINPSASSWTSVLISLGQGLWKLHFQNTPSAPSRSHNLQEIHANLGKEYGHERTNDKCLWNVCFILLLLLTNLAEIVMMIRHV